MKLRARTTEIRLRVVDSPGIKTAVDVELSVDGSRYRRQTGDVVPPIGEYVIIAGQGMLRGNLTFTASTTTASSELLTHDCRRFRTVNYL